MELVDIVMIGAGLASTSLALALVNNGWRGQIVMLEASDCFNTHKTWCFWDTGALPDYLRPLCVRHWNHWQVSTPTEQHIALSQNTPYCCIRAEDFFSFAEACFSRSDIDVRFNSQATCIEGGLSGNTAFGARVSACGGQIHARYGVDSSIDVCEPDNSGLFQSFYGAWVLSEKNVFNADVVGLMEEMTVIDGDLQFIYRLPLSSSLSLIEVTRFGITPVNPGQLRRYLDLYLGSQFTEGLWTIQSLEEGILPMQVSERSATRSHWLKAGIAAGHLRASTGYGFLPVQRWSQMAASALRHGKRPSSASPIVWRYQLMDRLFLSVLRKDMSIAPDLFQNLARRCHADPFARFMTEAASFTDLLRIIYAIPQKKQFLKALFQCLV
ncbi:lycopene cyclase family protein [Endozoicomonas lisbonensis]|uniref:Lycopene beta-cyclase n=1 Tax=Endozoicomonas lisbonensis TaxID=3120522 RepID=A0ABV2SDF2_9GAMM